MAGARRKARTTIFQALYEIDFTGHNSDDVVNHLLAEKGLSEENNAFVRQQVSGVIQSKQEIDENIKRFAPAWPVDQLPAEKFGSDSSARFVNGVLSSVSTLVTR